MLVRLDRRTTQVADLPSDIEPILASAIQH
jgi:hypothetical protein